MGVKRRTRGLRVAFAALGVAGLGAGCVAGTSGGASTAQATSLTLEYSCTFPLIGAQPMTVEINADIPSEIGVGEPTGEFQIDATATVNESARTGLRTVGAATLEGAAQADANLSVPNMELPVEVAMTIPTVDIPAESGAFGVQANGSTPSLTFGEDNAGTGTITVNDLVLQLAPRDANGNLTGLGEFESECTLEPGQDNVLHTFTISDGGSGSTTTTEPDPTTTTTEPDPTTTTTEPDPTTTTTEPEPGDPIELSYALTGESFINAANGTIPLTGSIDVEFDLAAGTYTADLNLDPTAGTFNILGFLQTMVSVEFEETGSTTGELADGVLTSSSELAITLSSVNTFGLPIGGGPNCTTVEPAVINLQSPEGELFDPLSGGDLQGTYTLPGLDTQNDNCGWLGWLIDLFVQGPDNTIQLTLTATD